MGEAKKREREKKNLNTEQAPCFGSQEYHSIASILFTYDTQQEEEEDAALVTVPIRGSFKARLRIWLVGE